MLLPLKHRLKQSFFFDALKNIEYLAVVAASCKHCFGLSPRTEIYIFLSSPCVDKLCSKPKILTFLPKSKFEIKISEHESNRIQHTFQNRDIYHDLHS